VVQDAPKAGQNRKRNCKVWVLSVFRSKPSCSPIRNVIAGRVPAGVCAWTSGIWVPVGRSPDEPRAFLSLFYSALILSAAWGLQSAISLVSSGSTFIVFVRTSQIVKHPPSYLTISQQRDNHGNSHVSLGLRSYFHEFPVLILLTLNDLTRGQMI